MAETSTQQVIIEFIAKDDGLTPTIDKLASLGVVEKTVADAFKKTNAEIQKQQTVAAAAGKAQQSAAGGTKKSIDDLDKAVKTLTNDFIVGFEEGVVEALQAAGVTMEEFQAALKGTTTETSKFAERIADVKKRLEDVRKTNSFQGLQQQISDARQRVLQTATALERLRRTGGIDTEQFKTLSEELKEQQGTLKELEESYDAVINSAESYREKVEETLDPVENLRKRLGEIVKQLAIMKLSGEDATDPARYQQLTEEAGQLRDTLGDVNEEINRAGSDTGGLDSLLQIAGGLTGGFSALQGATALFGTESEDLQEVLLNVNSAMAVASGLQQVQALWAARLTVARGLETAATTVQTAAQTAYNFVVGTSIGLMRVFRIALASTGIGLLVIAIIELVSYLSQTSEQLKTVNRELERNKNIVEADTTAIRGLTDEYIHFAESRNALESDLIRLRGRGLQQERQVLAESNARLQEQISLVERGTEAWFLLNKQIDDNNTTIRALDRQTIQAAIDLERQLAEERLNSQIATTERAISLAAEGSRAQLELQQKLVRDKLALDLQTQALTEAQRLQIIEQANRDQLELRLAFRRRELQLEIGTIEDRLRSVEEGSAAELRLRIELLQKQAAAEVQTTVLSEAEKMQIRENTANEIVRMELAFAARQRQIAAEQAAQVRADIIQAATERNAAQLALAREGSEEQLQLQLASIELAATEERRAAGQNALAIQRINAESEARKLEVKRAFIQRALEFEYNMEVTKNARIRRAAEEAVNNPRNTFQQRQQALNDLFDLEIEDINRRRQLNRDFYAEGIIDEKDYLLTLATLDDEAAQAREARVRQQEQDERNRNARRIQNAIEVNSQLIGLLDSLYSAQSSREQARLEEQRTRIDELRESGAITEKEAERRRKQLEVEERKAQQRQAQREKQIAVFRALLAIPQAFLQGAAQGGPILGAIYAAIAAAQAAIVFSTPIPKFGKGKKNNYEGPAEVGETGWELIESNGRMSLAKKSTLVWLGAKDKVYNPTETAAMLEKPGLRAARLPEASVAHTAAGMQIDYDKFGASVAKAQRNLSINIDGYKNFVINGHNFDTYLNSRRGY